MSETTWTDKKTGRTYAYEAIAGNVDLLTAVLYICTALFAFGLGFYVALVPSPASPPQPPSLPGGLLLVAIGVFAVTFMVRYAIRTRRRFLVCPHCSGRIPGDTLGPWGH
jgi:hypothetical protein